MARLIAFFAITLVLSTGTTTSLSSPWYACTDVFKDFVPCMGSVEGIFKEPMPECCKGLRHLNKIVKHDDDAERVCQCIELMAKADHPPFLANAISSLPSLCLTQLAFPISVNMDCSTLKNNKVSEAAP